MMVMMKICLSSFADDFGIDIKCRRLAIDPILADDAKKGDTENTYRKDKHNDEKDKEHGKKDIELIKHIDVPPFTCDYINK